MVQRYRYTATVQAVPAAVPAVPATCAVPAVPATCTVPAVPATVLVVPATVPAGSVGSAANY